MKMHWAIFFTLVLNTIAAPTSHEKRQHILYEAKDVKNTWAESRPARNTDNYEVPEDCEKLEDRCTELSEPVCGTDGITHLNKCKLKLSYCYKPEDNVTIAHLGECVRENESYIRKNKVITDGNEITNNGGNENDEAMLDSDGCWYEVLNKVLPYGTKGYEKCVQMECQQDKLWYPTGERLLNCDVGIVKCWNWETDETVPLETTMDFECNQYLCTEEDWELNGESKSCEGCLSTTTGEYLPQGFNGYWKCEQFECLKNNSWQETDERLPGCSIGEVKCWDWNQDSTVPIDSELIHNDIKFICTEDDWQQIDIPDSFSSESEGCLSEITNEVEPYETKGYYLCEQFECTRNNTWQNTGEKLSGCSPGEMKCFHWYDNEVVPMGSVLYHKCKQYMCSNNDWKKTTNMDPSCPETEGCLSEITNEMEPYETKGYYMCDQFECTRNNTWQNTGEKLSGCSYNEMKCLNWYNNEIVPIGSVMFHKCSQYICLENDWEKTTNMDSSCHGGSCWDNGLYNKFHPKGTVGFFNCQEKKCINGNWKNTGVIDPACGIEGEGCLHPTYPKVFPIGNKGYYKCVGMECKSDKTWQPNGETLLNCPGTVKCWNAITNASLPVNSTAYFDCHQYICTEHDDWKQTWKRDPACGETNGCWRKSTQEEVPYGYKGYYNCEQFECTENWDWKNTGEKLSGCSAGNLKCWDWHQDAAVPVNSVLVHKNIQYTCTQKDWETTTLRDPSPGNDGCWYTVANKMFPYGTKGFEKCVEMECKLDSTWQPTGERMPNCEDESMKCMNWQTNEHVPLESTMYFECNNYLCTQDDWMINGDRNSSCETEGCMSKFTNEVVPYDHKGYFKCEQFQCLKSKSWQKTGEKLFGCSNGEVKCWDWNQGAAVPINSTLLHNNVQYECTEEDWKPLPETAIYEDAQKEERFDAESECVPGVTSEHEGQQCCCSDEHILDCNGPCPELELTTMSEMETAMSEMETTMNEMEMTMNEMETTTSKMEKTTKDSSSSKKEISLLVILLSAVLFWI